MEGRLHDHPRGGTPHRLGRGLSAHYKHRLRHALLDDTVGNGVVIRKVRRSGPASCLWFVVPRPNAESDAVRRKLDLHHPSSRREAVDRALPRRIFPSETFRRIAQGLQAILLLHGTLFIVPFATQCVPVQSIWDRTITDRQCLNLQAVGYSSGGLAMAEDIAILLLPIPYVWRLKISLRRRLAVIALFSIGSL
ncbi:uncharacterized protein BDZ83DRAFT_105448 [Colletotrichum acutatum]|uniref:Rhodopsin domain-containing protein n=1 Tax=Glomerella acutata TaxID=27357 RepID=A0AAD8XD17_GLOAC|nr:uncharacterized protein BDZ83DRAFT_105448 [Colletotrichum acutatum]KAK1712247.1 hypothetical protein BDZ83DRAFT_105448 [Colletotrichum acutatum]